MQKATVHSKNFYFEHVNTAWHLKSC